MSKLNDERNLGVKAQRAYDDFIKPFIEEKREVFFEGFQAASTTDVDGILEIKRMMKLLDTLDNEVQSIINTGKMASTTLKQQDEKDGD